MLLETVPLYLLFELSVLVAAVCERRTTAPPTAGQPVPTRERQVSTGAPAGEAHAGIAEPAGK